MLVVTACLQGTLLVMAIYFEYFGPNSKRKGAHRTDEDSAPNGTAPQRLETGPTGEPVNVDRPSEETPLLQSQ